MPGENKDSAAASLAQEPVSPGPKDREEKDQEDGLVHITEGYYKYTDILFDWPKYMNIWHVSQLKSPSETKDWLSNSEECGQSTS